MRLLAPEGSPWAGGHKDFLDHSDQEIPIEEGDVVVLYTDGINEAMDDRARIRAGAVFGHASRARRRAARGVGSRAGGRRAALRPRGRQSDDLTLVVLQFNQWVGREQSLVAPEVWRGRPLRSRREA